MKLLEMQCGQRASVSDKERMMLDTFGEEYRAYVHRAGRFLPRLIYKSD